MADITAIATTTSQSRVMRSLVFVSDTVGYLFYVQVTSGDLFYTKTTNGGLTWGTGVLIKAGTGAAMDVWYDQWTPGDTGRSIHIWIMDGAIDDILYYRLNTANDVMSTVVTVFAGLSVAAARGIFVSGTKTRGGNLFCVFDMDTFLETGTYKSTDNGATWTLLTNALEATIDQCRAFPANAADPNDVWLLYQDASTDELTIKTYDDSAGTYSESAALTMVENTTDQTGQYGFDGSIRHSDGHLIFAFVNAYDSATGDFLVYDWDGTTATALTALTTDIDDIYYPSVFLNQDQPDWIYVAYLGLTDGLEALATGVGAYYALSKDRGVSWTKDIAYSTSVTDYRQTWTPLNGERFIVAWMDISAVTIVTNQDNSKEFGFTKLNNYQAARAVGQNNTGIISANGGRG